MAAMGQNPCARAKHINHLDIAISLGPPVKP